MLYTPKQTVAQISTSGNDYLLAVKGNQPKLWAQLQTALEQVAAQTMDTQIEQTRDRWTQRTVSVMNTVPGMTRNGLSCEWNGWGRELIVQSAKQCFTLVLSLWMLPGVLNAFV